MDFTTKAMEENVNEQENEQVSCTDNIDNEGTQSQLGSIVSETEIKPAVKTLDSIMSSLNFLEQQMNITTKGTEEVPISEPNVQDLGSAETESETDDDIVIIDDDDDEIVKELLLDLVDKVVIEEVKNAPPKVLKSILKNSTEAQISSPLLEPTPAETVQVFEPPNWKVVDVTELECHFKWRKELKDSVNDAISRRLWNAIQGLSAFKNANELRSEVFPSRFISYKCIQSMFLAFRAEDESKIFDDALQNIRFIKENLASIFNPNFNGYGYDLAGVYYLLDSVELYIGYLQGTKSKMQKMFRLYDELSPRSKAFILAVKLEYFKLAYEPTEKILNIAKEIVDLDPNFSEWQIIHVKALRKHRLDGDRGGRVRIIPWKEELNSLGLALELKKDAVEDNCIALLTMCDILCDFLKAGCVNHKVKIAGNIFNGKDDIVDRIKGMLEYLNEKYPKSVRIKIFITEFFRMSQLSGAQRDKIVANEILEELMKIFPRHPKVFREQGLKLMKSSKIDDLEQGIEYLEGAMGLEPLNSAAVLTYLKFLVGFGGTKIANIRIFNKQLEMAETEKWPLNFRLTVMFFRGCLCWIEEDHLTALDHWIYGYNYAIKTLAHDKKDTSIKNPFLEKFWYLTRSQIKKNAWPFNLIGWKEVSKYLETRKAILTKGEEDILALIKEELNEIGKEGERQRKEQNYPDPINLEKHRKKETEGDSEVFFIDFDTYDSDSDDSDDFLEKIRRDFGFCSIFNYLM